MPRPKISIRLIGPVDISVDGSPLAVDTRKAVALLAYLAVTGRPTSRDSLAALLWPESEGPDARGALRRTLSVLNAALGGRGLAIDRSTVAIRPGEMAVDLLDFRAALGRARDHRHDPGIACRSCDEWLETALALDRGPFMDGFGLRDSEPFDEWQTTEAEAHRRDLAAALERLARSKLAAGSWDRAVATGRRWLGLDPLHEPAHRFLMSAYAAAGEDAPAIRQYRECVRVLDAELGVPPLDETTELYEAIRTGAFRAAVEVGGTAAPTEHGVAPSDWMPEHGPLVGRTVELERLLGVTRSIDVDGRLLVIEGEPGIGKTRLARALLERLANDGAIALEARAYVGEAAIPYAAVAELVRSGLGRPDGAARLTTVPPEVLVEVARLVPIPGVRAGAIEHGDPLRRARLLDALAVVMTALVAGPRPGIIWLDDAQWADASTFEAMAFLARRLRNHPIGLLLTWRREDLSEPIADDLVAAAQAEGRAEVVVLGRLKRDDVATLARLVLGQAATPTFVDALFTESEGLPLYLAEALSASRGEAAMTPGGIDMMVRRRLASTTEIARQVVSAAAAIGRSFDLETVRSASGRGEEEAVAALEELSRRGIVREVGPADAAVVRYDFTHARLRDVAYEALGLARRRLLHRRIAESLAAPGGGREGGVRWSLIAYHERLAGRLSEAADAHRRAGEHARSVYANAEAREHLEAALALGHPASGELHEELGQVLTLLADYRGAIAHLETAAADAEPGRLAAIEHELGRVHARRGDWDRAEAHLAAALSAAGDGDPGRRSAILADRSAVAHRRLDREAAELSAEEALAIATGVGDRTAMARAQGVLGMLARRRGDLDAARAHLERALLAADPDTHPDLRIAALNTLALVVADRGEQSAAIDLTREALSLCERIGDRHRQAALENNLADLFHADGRHEEAMEHLKRAVSIFAEVGGRPDELEPEIWKLVEW